MRLQRDWPTLVLASGSSTRARLLKEAGLHFTVVPPSFNEPEARRAAREKGASATAAASLLAEGKARQISAVMPEALVIGADQILALGESSALGETWLGKPAGQKEAAEQLRVLRGRKHRLASAVAVASAGEVRFAHASEATLRFLPFSDALLKAVLQADEAAIGTSVGGYRLEGPGILLCEDIVGDHFTILGLPMLPLLAFLRTSGVLIA